MLDIFDFFGDKGATPEKIRESQRKRYASEEVVDQIIAMAEAAKAGEYLLLLRFRTEEGFVSCLTVVGTARYNVTRKGAEANAVQKEIGAKKKVRRYPAFGRGGGLGLIRGGGVGKRGC